MRWDLVFGTTRLTGTIPDLSQVGGEQSNFPLHGVDAFALLNDHFVEILNCLLQVSHDEF